MKNDDDRNPQPMQFNLLQMVALIGMLGICSATWRLLGAPSLYFIPMYIATYCHWLTHPTRPVLYLALATTCVLAVLSIAS